jgi:hypothetical protein
VLDDESAFWAMDYLLMFLQNYVKEVVIIIIL